MNKKVHLSWQFFVLLIVPILFGGGCVIRSNSQLEPGPTPNFDNAAGEKTADSSSAFRRLPEGELKVDAALEIALVNDRELQVEKMKISRARLDVVESEARFDPRLSARVRHSSRLTERERETAEGYRVTEGRSQRFSGNIGLSKQFWTGTEIGAEFGTVVDRIDGQYESDLELDISQPLLQGSGEVNLVGLRQSELAAEISRYQFEGYLDSLLEEIEMAYWDLVLARERREILRRDVELAEENLQEVQRRIEVGRLAADEEASARAQLASARGRWLEARDQYEQEKLRFLQKLNVEGWREIDEELKLVDPPPPGDEIPPVDRWLQRAENERPELLEARLDFFVTLGTTGYSDSFDGAVEDMDASSYNIAGGLNFNLPLGRRQAHVADEQAQLAYRQQELSLRNLEESVMLDVLEAHMALEQTRRQVEATEAVRAEREATLRAEEARFEAGKIAYIQVARARHELTESRLNELEAIIDHRRARVRLYRLSGQLAVLRGFTPEK